MALAALSFTSCEKDNDNNNNNNNGNNNPQTASISLEFEHVWGSDAVSVPHTGHFVTNSGEHIMFSKLQYYISNIELIENDGDLWAEDYSYHLLELGDDNTLHIDLDNVPVGDYTGIRYMIGVDSTSNVSGPQTGALDPANNMFWSWSNGYIFLKAEGMEHMSSTNFTYHIGGFRNANSTNAIQEMSFDFAPMMAEVKPNANPVIHHVVDVQKFFDGSGMNLQVANQAMVHMPGAMAVNISRNYREMFVYDHVHN